MAVEVLVGIEVLVVAAEVIAVRKLEVKAAEAIVPALVIQAARAAVVIIELVFRQKFQHVLNFITNKYCSIVFKMYFPAPKFYFLFQFLTVFDKKNFKAG